MLARSCAFEMLDETAWGPPACLLESLLHWGPEGRLVFQEGMAVQHSVWKAFPRMVIEGRFIWKELVSASGQAPLGGPLRDRIPLGVCWEPLAPAGPASSVKQTSGLARWVSADLRGTSGEGIAAVCCVCQAVLPTSYVAVLFKNPGGRW